MSTQDVTTEPLFSFTTPAARRTAITQWERIDDVIMGGVSSSRLVEPSDPNQRAALWTGVLRVDGGGFCGTRTRPLVSPIDLSRFAGIYIDAALISDGEVASRVWKMTLRTQNDRGEVVYQAEWQPSNADALARAFLPFTSFRLVRGPLIIPGAPPLSADLLASVYQLGLTISKFRIADPSGALPYAARLSDAEFRSGPFRVALAELGAYRVGDRDVRSDALFIETTDATLSSPPFLLWLLRPLQQFVFSEAIRRRRQARMLLRRRDAKLSGWGARLWGQRVMKRGVKRMTRVKAFLEGLAELGNDLAVASLTLPLRLLFSVVFRWIRLLKRLRSREPQLKMPQLQ
eukprot:CAMPEP_0119342668 /NCGR_PEP_ID=MMETSP1333-20130426/105188_1 /TAXON_ID=418940 /ORGANISM="Scyphosphaera apsteinii, Strain RCC1455" /LENGTH=345 /DNA_ID=CAMNT_0007354933 /DNA_START=139 /DNA_END=1176 /DNA_ORIENTATION=-